MDFSNMLKQLRKEHNLTQKDLAKKVGVSIATIQGYEQNKYKPKAKTVCKIAEALNISPTKLLGLYHDDPILEHTGYTGTLDYLIEICINKLLKTSEEEKETLRNDILNDIRNAPEPINGNDDNVRRYFFELDVYYSHKILDIMLRNYIDWDIYDVTTTLGYYLLLNEEGQNKVLEYAEDLYDGKNYLA